MLHIIIFTKERQCQLNLLSQSMGKFLDAKQYENTLITETGKDFETATKEAVDSDCEYTMFLPDDCMFTREADLCFLDKAFKENISCFSLRLGIGIDYDLPLSIPIKPQWIKNIGDKIYTIVWTVNKGYFNYPMSIDGHIFRTKEIAEKINAISFENPNQLETLLSRNPIEIDEMAFHETPSVINLVLNRIQTTHQHNKSGHFPVELLQRKYDQGDRLDLDKIVESVKGANSCHVIPNKLYWKGGAND
jgi:hypothetical protein